MRYIILDLNDRNLNVSNLITSGYVIYALDEISASSLPFSDVDQRLVPIRKNRVPLDSVGVISKQLQTTKMPSTPDISTFQFSLNDYDLIETMDALGVSFTDCFVNICLNTNIELLEEETLIKLFFACDIYRFSIYQTRQENNILKLNCDTSRLYRTLPDVVTNPYSFRAVRAPRVTDVTLKTGQIEQRSKTGALITNQFKARAVVDPAKGWSRPEREPIQFDQTFYYGWIPNLGSYDYDGSYWYTLRSSPYTSGDVGFWLEIEDPDLQTDGPLYNGNVPLNNMIGSTYLITLGDGEKYTAEFIGSTQGFWRGLSTGVVPHTIGRGWYYFFKLDELSIVKFRQATVDDWKKSPFSYQKLMSIGTEHLMFQLPKGSRVLLPADPNIILTDEHGNELNNEDFGVFEKADGTESYLFTSESSHGILKYEKFAPELVEPNNKINPLVTASKVYPSDVVFSSIVDDDIEDARFYTISPQDKPELFVNKIYRRDIVMKLPKEKENEILRGGGTFTILTRALLHPVLNKDVQVRIYFWLADKYLNPIEDENGEFKKRGLVEILRGESEDKLLQNINKDFPAGLLDSDDLLRYGSYIIDDLEIPVDVLKNPRFAYVVFSFEQDQFPKITATDHSLKLAYINFANKTELSYNDLETIYISRNVSASDTVPQTISRWGSPVWNSLAKARWNEPDPFCESTSYIVPATPSEFDFVTDGYVKAGNTFTNFEILANQNPYNLDIRTKQAGFPDGSDTLQSLIFDWKYAWRDSNMSPKSLPSILEASFDDAPDEDLPTELNISWTDRFGNEQTLEIFNSPSFQTLITSASEIKKTIKSSVEITSDETNNWVDLLYPELISNFNKTRKVVKRDYKFNNIDFGELSNEQIIYTIVRFILKTFGTGHITLTVPYIKDVSLGDYITNIKHPHIKFGKYVADGFVGEITVDVQSMLMSIKLHNINLLYDSSDEQTLYFLDTAYPDTLIYEDITNTFELIRGVL